MTDYDAGYFIGILFGVITAGAAVAIYLWFTRKDRAEKCKYDERQILVRGKGYQYAFSTLLVYNMLYVVIGNYIELIAARSVILFFGIILSAVVYASYAIWNEGYFPFNDKPKSWIGIFLAMAVLSIVNGLRDISYYGLWKNGVISDHIIGCMAGGCILFVLAVLFAKRYCKKREGQDEE